MRRTSRLPDALFYALLVGFGLGLTIPRALELEEYSRVTDWEKTEGTIVCSQYKSMPTRMFFLVGPKVRNNRTAPRRVIRYEYEIDGQVRSSERLAFGEIRSLAYLQKDYGGLFKRYPKGEKVTVYFDPLRPRRAVLQRSVQFEGICALGCGVFLIVFGMGSFFKLRPVQEEVIDFSGRYAVT